MAGGHSVLHGIPELPETMDCVGVPAFTALADLRAVASPLAADGAEICIRRLPEALQLQRPAIHSNTNPP